MKKLLYITFIFFLYSCEQEEIGIDPHTQGERNNIQIELEQDYKKQVYYSIDNNEITSENLKTEWDLAFEASSNGWRIVLNSSKFSKISKIESGNFNENISEDSLIWNWEIPLGINYGTALGDYRTEEVFFVIDNGFNLSGLSNGYKKIKIEEQNEYYYKIKFSNLDNTNLDSLKIYKNEEYNFIYFSFTNGIINIEPEKNNWDLLFTQYTHLYNDPSLPPAYLVTGVLINYLNNTKVAKDTINNFENIKYNMVSSYNFSDYQNIIGFDWKEFDGSNYSITPNLTFIIETSSNRYFKLRFTDFYNSSGVKGYPTFEIQEL